MLRPGYTLPTVISDRSAGVRLLELCFIIKTQLSMASSTRNVAILDIIGEELETGLVKSTVPNKSHTKSHKKGNNLSSACARGDEQSPSTSGSNKKATNVVSEPSAGGNVSPTEFQKLESIVHTLVGQMQVFVEKLQEDEHSQLVSDHADDLGGEDNSEPSNPVQFYEVSETVGTDVDKQLAGIITTVSTSRLSEDKLREKSSLYVRPANCPPLVATRVNPEIWDKLSPLTRSKDIKFQKVQKSIIHGMVAVTSCADLLVKATRNAETIGVDKMAGMVTSLVDGLALITNANQELNQCRRDDHRSDLNDAYKSLCTPNHEIDTTEWLYGPNLPARIKDMNETNKMSSQLGTRRSSTSFGTYGRRSYPRGGSTRDNNRVHPYSQGKSWTGKFRDAFLGRGHSLHARDRPQCNYKQGARRAKGSTRQ